LNPREIPITIKLPLIIILRSAIKMALTKHTQRISTSPTNPQTNRRRCADTLRRENAEMVTNADSGTLN
jgi:hypothetical protein